MKNCVVESFKSLRMSVGLIYIMLVFALLGSFSGCSEYMPPQEPGESCFDYYSRAWPNERLLYTSDPNIIGLYKADAVILYKCL